MPSSLSAIEELVPAVRDLGKRHVGYGITDRHYDTVGCCGRIGQGLGTRFTKEVEGCAHGVLATDAAAVRAA